MTSTPQQTDTTTVRVVVRYWAAAKQAAGTGSEELTGSTVDEVLAAAVAAHPALDPVAAVATVLLDGRAVERGAPVAPGMQLEVLPPFAGG